MDLKFPYWSRFEALAHAVTVDEPTQKLATASLRNLAKVFDDKEIIEKIDDNPDLLFISSALILLNEFNLNGDGVLAEDILPVSHKFADKPLNEEHDRKDIRGAICEVSYNTFGTNELVDEDSVLERSKTEKIQLVIGGYLWRLVDKELCTLVEESSAAQDGRISTSFEILFSNYWIGVYGEDNLSISAARIIKPEDEEWAAYDKKLVANGGTGIEGGKKIGRILKPAILPAGAGIVVNPASGIKGILAVDSSMIEPEENELDSALTKEFDDEEEQECDLEMEDGSVLANIKVTKSKYIPEYIKARLVKKVIVKNNIKESISSVSTPNQETIMEIKTLEDIKLDLFKNEAQANEVRQFIEKEYVTAAREYAEKFAAKENEAKAAAEARAIAEAAVEDFKTKYAALAEELNKLRDEQAALASEQAFNTRMAALDEVFELDAEERGLLVEEIQACASDEAFAKFMDKQKKLMKEKTKVYKKEKMEKEAKASADAEKVALDAKAALASVKEIPGQDLSNGVAETATLKEKILSAFAKNTTIGGKAVKE